MVSGGQHVQRDIAARRCCSQLFDCALHFSIARRRVETEMDRYQPRRPQQ